MILDTDHNENVSPQLHFFMSLQFDIIWKLFWTLITMKKVLPSWVPLWVCNLIPFENNFRHWLQGKRFSSVESLYESATWFFLKMTLDTDYKEKFFYESSTWSYYKKDIYFIEDPNTKNS